MSQLAGEPMRGTYVTLHEFISGLNLGKTETVMEQCEEHGVDCIEDLDDHAEAATGFVPPAEFASRLGVTRVHARKILRALARRRELLTAVQSTNLPEPSLIFRDLGAGGYHSPTDVLAVPLKQLAEDTTLTKTQCRKIIKAVASAKKQNPGTDSPSVSSPATTAASPAEPTTLAHALNGSSDQIPVAEDAGTPSLLRRLSEVMPPNAGFALEASNTPRTSQPETPTPKTDGDYVAGFASPGARRETFTPQDPEPEAAKPNPFLLQMRVGPQKVKRKKKKTPKRMKSASKEEDVERVSTATKDPGELDVGQTAPSADVEADAKAKAEADAKAKAKADAKAKAEADAKAKAEADAKAKAEADAKAKAEADAKAKAEADAKAKAKADAKAKAEADAKAKAEADAKAKAEADAKAKAEADAKAKAEADAKAKAEADAKAKAEADAKAKAEAEVKAKAEADAKAKAADADAAEVAKSQTASEKIGSARATKIDKTTANRVLSSGGFDSDSLQRSALAKASRIRNRKARKAAAARKRRARSASADSIAVEGPTPTNREELSPQSMAKARDEAHALAIEKQSVLHLGPGLAAAAAAAVIASRKRRQRTEETKVRNLSLCCVESISPFAQQLL